MKYQALLLALVILISLLISPNGLKNLIREPVAKIQTAVQAPAQTAVNNSRPSSFYAFMDDLGSAILGQAVALAKNLSSAGRLLAANLNDVISRPSVAIIENQTQSSSSVDSAVLNLQTDIAPSKFFSCDFDETQLTSEAVLVKNLQQFPSASQTIFQLNSNKRWPVASLSKLMTATIAFEKMDLNEEIIFSEKAISIEGTIGNFKVGEKFKLGDLIKAMLILSSNNAAYAIAENYEGGQQNFINEMQRKAAELKMFSTSYLEPTGLSFINQSTADDLAKLMEYIYVAHPEILEISRQKETQILELNSGKRRSLTNIDRFAGDSDFIGGKTGFIDESGRNLVGIFDINGTKILTITLGSEDAFAQTTKLKNFVRGCE